MDEVTFGMYPNLGCLATVVFIQALSKTMAQVTCTTMYWIKQLHTFPRGYILPTPYIEAHGMYTYHMVLP